MGGAEHSGNLNALARGKEREAHVVTGRRTRAAIRLSSCNHQTQHNLPPQPEMDPAFVSR
jgi:hypothetical protein